MSAYVRGLGPPCFPTLVTSWSSFGEWEHSAQFLFSIQRFFWSQLNAVFSPTRLHFVQALRHIFHLSVQAQNQSKYDQMHLLTKSSYPARFKFDFNVRPLTLWLHEWDFPMHVAFPDARMRTSHQTCLIITVFIPFTQKVPPSWQMYVNAEIKIAFDKIVGYVSFY